MALTDLVVDTNVLRHADNPDNKHFDASGEFILRMLECDTLLCVDEGFALDDSNSSLIGAEYIEQLQFENGLGFALLVELVDADRVIVRERSLSATERRAVNQLVTDPRDRTLLALAINSEARTLASHDDRAYGKRKRVIIKRRFSVEVLDAISVCALL